MKLEILNEEISKKKERNENFVGKRERLTKCESHTRFDHVIGWLV